MADDNQAPPTPNATDTTLTDQPDQPAIELSERARALIEETAALVVELPD